MEYSESCRLSFGVHPRRSKTVTAESGNVGDVNLHCVKKTKNQSGIAADFIISEMFVIIM